ncbi:MAG: hypothetical protein ACMUIS_03505, partial [bacterium]
MKRIFSNADIVRIAVGVPDGHRHIRTIIETTEGDAFVLQEATIAGIVRAYTLVTTHPQRKAIELKQTPLTERKHGYAEPQWMETEQDERL